MDRNGPNRREKGGYSCRSLTYQQTELIGFHQYVTPDVFGPFNYFKMEFYAELQFSF